MRIPALISLTLRELFAKATLIILAAISTLVLIGVAFAVSIQTGPEGSSMILFGQPATPPLPEADLFKAIAQMQATLAGGLFTGIILFGIFATAGVIPDALEKGTVDLYLSKPIARWELLLGKALGAITGILANVLYFFIGLWLVFGLKTGVWDPQILLAAGTMIFIFACLYSLVIFFGVLSRNTAVSIIVVYLYLFVIGAILQNREATLYLISTNVVYRTVIDGFYYLLPQIAAMQENGAKQILGATMDWKPFVQSFLSALAIFLGSAVILRNRDF
jgi:ABC-type transport system involved in multi-copper enzyme maturation permease subunit